MRSGRFSLTGSLVVGKSKLNSKHRSHARTSRTVCTSPFAAARADSERDVASAVAAASVRTRLGCNTQKCHENRRGGQAHGSTHDLAGGLTPNGGKALRNKRRKTKQVAKPTPICAGRYLRGDYSTRVPPRDGDSRGIIAPTSAGPCCTGPLVRTCPAPFYISNSLSSAPPTCMCARGEVCGVGRGGSLLLLSVLTWGGVHLGLGSVGSPSTRMAS